ncbi:hypothetical protein [Pseudomonas poae]
MSERDVNHLVRLLPLHELAVFQTSRSQQAGTLASQSVFELITRPANELAGAANRYQTFWKECTKISSLSKLHSWN